MALGLTQPQTEISKVKVNQSRYGPAMSQSFTGSHITTTAQDDGLSALRTGRFYPPGNTHGTHFC